jgi:hypothetical protein
VLNVHTTYAVVLAGLKEFGLIQSNGLAMLLILSEFSEWSDL